MDKLDRCKHCGGAANISVRQKIGVPSGDHGFFAKIECTTDDCRIKVERWALKKQWAVDSAIAAWNRRAPVNNEPLTVEQLKQMDGEPVWFQSDCGEEWWRLLANGKSVEAAGGYPTIYFNDGTYFWWTRTSNAKFYRFRTDRPDTLHPTAHRPDPDTGEGAPFQI
jgi:hypothetical protein